MFTGIIEAQGQLRSSQALGDDLRMWIGTPTGFLEQASLGDSIAVNGVCLTVNEMQDGAFAADLSRETLQLTTAGGWQSGQALNLEPALTLAKPLGGHLVSGHVDGIGHLRASAPDARSLRLEFEVPAELARYIARKGSITIDGVSLTVNSVDGCRFGVNIVPHTLTHTSLGSLQPDDPVNLEVDLLARYLERLISSTEKPA